jgi:putative flippase GtrA
VNSRARLPSRSTVRQFARFSTVGLGNAGISLCVDALLLAAGLPDVPAAAAAFAAGALNGYVFNRRWTFDARDSTRTRLAYVAVQIGGLGATVALVAALRAATEAPGLLVYIAAACPVTVGMFLVNRTWTFGTATRE